MEAFLCYDVFAFTKQKDYMKKKLIKHSQFLCSNNALLSTEKSCQQLFLLFIRLKTLEFGRRDINDGIHKFTAAMAGYKASEA